MRRHRLTVAIAAMAVLVAACGSDTSVGSDELLEGAEDGSDARLGETTTTEAPATTAPAATAAPQQTQPPQTTAPPATAPPTTPPPQQAAIEIKIQPDAAGNQFDPTVAQVFVGSIVKFTNTDSVPRSVEGAGGAFSSGELAPGASWEYKADTVGTFNYADGTRPYAGGKLEVLAR